MQHLGDRQTEVLMLAAHGLSGSEIGECLSISHHTVRNHLLFVRRKLGARNTMHAVALAAAQGLIRLDGLLSPIEPEPFR